MTNKPVILKPVSKLFIFKNMPKWNFIWWNVQYHIIIFMQKLQNIKIKSKRKCSDFGHADGMTGCCVDCSVDNKELFEKCLEYNHSNLKNEIKKRKESK